MANGDDALSDVAAVGRGLPNGVPPCFCFSLWRAFERPMKNPVQQEERVRQQQQEEEEEEEEGGEEEVVAYRPWTASQSPFPSLPQSFSSHRQQEAAKASSPWRPNVGVGLCLDPDCHNRKGRGHGSSRTWT